jgi:type II secretory ATPase GspE/PulE/Tfp pilus assembly ATPase PilB-like protein
MTDPLECLTPAELADRLAERLRQRLLRLLDLNRCPVCRGLGEIEEGTGYPSEEGGELTRMVECPECDGTGMRRRARDG